jgi:hypothetical protein
MWGAGVPTLEGEDRTCHQPSPWWPAVAGLLISQVAAVLTVETRGLGSGLHTTLTGLSLSLSRLTLAMMNMCT